MPTTRTRCDAATTGAAYAHGADEYDAVWSPAILSPAEAVVQRLDPTKTT